MREGLNQAAAVLDRRTFIARLSGATAAAMAATSGGVLRPVALAGQEGSAERRRERAFQIRLEAAKRAASRPMPANLGSGDEARYPNRIGSYSKALPHNQLGEVDPAAYQSLLDALESGDPADFERIRMGLGQKLTNPQAGLAFDLEGPDPGHIDMPPAPPLDSPAAAADLSEVYWMALCRDVAFGEYEADPLIAEAAADLSRLQGFFGPKSGNRVTPGTIFRGDTLGDSIGPYLSQFLWLDIPMGAVRVAQRMTTLMPGREYMTSYDQWLDIQNGLVVTQDPPDPTPRYIRNLRDLSQWVHVDALYQAYHQACLILLGLGAPTADGDPYKRSETQIGFATLGGPHILTLVTEVATRALKAVWYQKWLVQRRLRPEAMAGLVHQTRTGMARRPLDDQIVNSLAVDRTAEAHRSYLLPQAWPEGSPTHPSYGAGHGTVAGACVTMLKAYFDESFVIPNPVVADRTGLSLLPYSGPALTVGNELNKLAYNVALGRNAGGVHYRSDAYHSVRLGERIAAGIMEEQKACFNEQIGFAFTSFDGQPIRI